jgi:hypothetical protein
MKVIFFVSERGRRYTALCCALGWLAGCANYNLTAGMAGMAAGT